MLVTASTFALQVVSKNRIAALAPYLVLVVVLFGRDGGRRSEQPFPVSGDILVLGFFSVQLIKIATLSLQTVSIAGLPAAVFNYVVPVFGYLAFRLKPGVVTEKEVFVALTLAGLLAAGFWAYDSLLRLLASEVPGFSLAAYEYSLSAMNMTPENMNPSRINPYSRAFGIMVNHARSAAWTSVGAFAAFNLFPIKYRRRIALLAFALLGVGMYFTGFIVFAIVYALIYSEPAVRWRSKILRLRTVPTVRRLTDLLALVVLLLVTLNLASGPVADRILSIVRTQFLFILGRWEVFEASYLELTVKYLFEYFARAARAPWVLLFGVVPEYDRYVGFNGDTGFVDSVGFLGLALFFITIGLFVAVIITLRQLRRNDYTSRGLQRKYNMRRFVAVVFVYFFLMDIHYNVWMDKSLYLMLTILLGIMVGKETQAIE